MTGRLASNEPFEEEKPVCSHRLHRDEIKIHAALVQRLLEQQFRDWSTLPLQLVTTAGTDNVLFRLGDDMLVRLPRTKRAALAGVAHDSRWLPILAPHLPVDIPVPIATGKPAMGYPWEWGVYPWIQGAPPSPDAITYFNQLTDDLARFVTALHEVDLPDAPRARRGASLDVQDKETRVALVQLKGMIDIETASAAWDQALSTAEWSGRPTSVHGDLLPGNLLVEHGRLTGVIDWAGFGVGDPACDMIGAWGLLPPRARDAFRVAVGVDDPTWGRGRGWALSIGLIALPYYSATYPEFAATARRLIEQTLADYARDR